MNAAWIPSISEWLRGRPGPEQRARTGFDGRRRATLRLIEPQLQLRLPLRLFAITAVFAVLATFHSWYAYDELLETALPTAPPGYLDMLAEQTGAFMGLSFVLLLAYGLVVMAVCVAYLKGVVGPIVAFRRQIAALRRGDYTARNALRPDAPFQDLGSDLNDLAQALEVRREMRLLNH